MPAQLQSAYCTEYVANPSLAAAVQSAATVITKLVSSNELYVELNVWSFVVWLCGVVVGRRIRDREVASSIPGCSAARCNSGQVVHTHVPLFIKQYISVPASAGGKVHHRSGVGYAGSHSADLLVVGQPAPLQHRSYLWLPFYSGLEVTYVTYAAT